MNRIKQYSRATNLTVDEGMDDGIGGAGEWPVDVSIWREEHGAVRRVLAGGVVRLVTSRRGGDSLKVGMGEVELF